MSGEGNQAVQSGKLDINGEEGGDKGHGSGREVQGLSVFYTYSRSVINKMETLRSLVCTGELDIIGITETWLDTTGKHFLPEVEIVGFTLYHRDRVGRKGGGVALYVRSTLNSYVNTTVKSVSNAESLWVDIVTGGRKIVIRIMYRPPDLDEVASAPLIQEIGRAARYNNVCIMGDFNYRGIDWNRVTGDGNAEEFLNVIQNGFYQQLIREPTRQGNILDLVFTNN